MSKRCIKTARSWDATPLPGLSAWLLSALALFLLGIALGLLLPPASAPGFLAENGPIETVQAVLLGATSLIYLAAAIRSSDAKAAFCLFVSAACLLSIRRELPGCESVLFEGGACLTGFEKNAVTVAVLGWAAMSLALARIDWRAVLRPANLCWVWPTLLSGLLLASAELFEAAHHQEFEEILELAAYAHAGAFGLWLLATTGRSAVSRRMPPDAKKAVPCRP